MTWIALIVAAGIGAMLVGLIGFGSSLLILPVATFVFPIHFDADVALHLAVGTTLATMVVGAVSAGYAQNKSGCVSWPLLRIMMFAYLLGAGAGPWVSMALSAQWLRLYIGALLITIGALTLLKADAQPGLKSWVSSRLEIFCVHIFIGLLSAVGGIASGVFAIPYLCRFDLTLRTVIATSTLAAAFYSLVAATGYVVAGLGNEALPNGALGFVYLPAFALMSIAGIVCGPMGVRLGRRLSIESLRRILVIFLLLAGVGVLLQ